MSAYVHFAIAASELVLPRNRDDHVRALRAWKEGGILAYDSALERAIRDMRDQEAKLAWSEALLKYLRVNRPGIGPLTESCSGQDGIASLANVVRIAAVSEEYCDRAREEEAAAPALSRTLEIVTLARLDVSKEMTAARTLRETANKRGDRVQDIWDKRFSALAGLAAKILIADRYALVAHVRGKSGIGRILDFIAGSTRVNTARVELLTMLVSPTHPSEPSIKDQADAAFRLQKDFSESSRLRLSIFPIKRNISTAHERWLRFDSKAFVFEYGCRSFEGETVSETKHFAPISDINQCSADEQTWREQAYRDGKPRGP